MTTGMRIRRLTRPMCHSYERGAGGLLSDLAARPTGLSADGPLGRRASRPTSLSTDGPAAPRDDPRPANTRPSDRTGYAQRDSSVRTDPIDASIKRAQGRGGWRLTLERRNGSCCAAEDVVDLVRKSPLVTVGETNARARALTVPSRTRPRVAGHLAEGQRPTASVVTRPRARSVPMPSGPSGFE